MMSKMIHEADGQRTFALILEIGDEVVACVRNFAAANGLDAAAITGIGAFSDVELAYFDWESKEYRRRSFAEQLEVASLIGDIAVDEEDQPALHIHVVLGRRDYGALAGHIFGGRVRPTLELIVTESPAHLRRRKDSETGLALIRF